MSTPLFDAFEEYRRKTIPADASPTHVGQIHRAFIEGAAAMYRITDSIVDLPRDDGKELMEAAWSEMDDFLEEHHTEGRA